MKLTRKIFLLVIALILGTSILAGCNTIPDEYIDGVRLDSSYPEDDLPIYDDAVIYFCDADDETVSVKYGTEDDLDDVVDFYKDHFEDNEIILTDESDKSTRYSAEGQYMDFLFEIKVSEPSGEYEEEVFETVVKVDIEFVDDSLGTVSGLQDDTSGFSLQTDILGFWRQESFEDSSGKTATYDLGTAYEFLSDGTLNIYIDFTLFGAGGWGYVDETTILLTALDGSQENVTVILEKRSEKDYLIWTDSTGTLTFFLDSKDEFSTQSLPTPAPTTTMSGSDAQLSAFITDRTWYYIHYMGSDGQIQNGIDGLAQYNSDGTVYDEFGDNTYSGTWHISDGGLYCDYNDGSTASWNIEVGTLYNANYLKYLSSENTGAYWLFIDIPRDSIPNFSDNNEFYLLGEEMELVIAGLEFYELYYFYSDGSTEDMNENILTFYEDKTFKDYYYEVDYYGTWELADGYLKLYYDDGDFYQYPSFIEYDRDSDSYYLYFWDVEEGYEGCYWSFTTYQP